MHKKLISSPSRLTENEDTVRKNNFKTTPPRLGGKIARTFLSDVIAVAIVVGRKKISEQ